MQVPDSVEDRVDAALSEESDPAAQKIRTLQRQLYEERQKTEAMDRAIFKAIETNAMAMQVRPVKRPAKDRSTKRVHEIGRPFIGDTQWSKVTPTYSSEVAERRLRLYGEKVLDLLDVYRQSVPVDVLSGFLLGDIVEGEDIFPGQAYLIDSSVFEAAFHASEVLIDVIRMWLTETQHVHFDAAIGNHGRSGRKGQMSKVTNWDRVVYKVVDIALSGEPRFTINYAQPRMLDGEGGWYWLARHGDLRTLVMHGDQFQGSLGIPWYGIRKKVLGWKAMGANPRMAFPDFDDVVFGHWHQSLAHDINGIGVYCNGTTESWNDFAAEQLAGMGRPSQRLDFVHPGHGMVTFENRNVWLDDDDAPPVIPWDTLAAAAPDADDEEPGLLE